MGLPSLASEIREITLSRPGEAGESSWWMFGEFRSGAAFFIKAWMDSPTAVPEVVVHVGKTYSEVAGKMNSEDRLRIRLFEPKVDWAYVRLHDEADIRKLTGAADDE